MSPTPLRSPNSSSPLPSPGASLFVPVCRSIVSSLMRPMGSIMTPRLVWAPLARAIGNGVGGPRTEIRRSAARSSARPTPFKDFKN
eukprot:5776742-Pyramimonas_sp.AAC.1